MPQLRPATSSTREAIEDAPGTHAAREGGTAGQSGHSDLVARSSKLLLGWAFWFHGVPTSGGHPTHRGVARRADGVCRTEDRYGAP
jgi:hypothetical protein